jgi:hypothetical protein
MNTGDLVFFKHMNNSWWIVGKLIEWWTRSDFIHVGMILKDPKFLGLKGTYIWQAEPLGGVTVSLFDEKKRRFWTRKYIGEKPIDNEKLHDIFDITNGKPYDKNPFDWIEAMVGKDFEPQRTNAFWCSALVGCILTKLNMLGKNTDWSIMSPAYLANMESEFYEGLPSSSKSQNEVQC